MVWITTNWKILRDRNIRPPYLSPEKNLNTGQEAIVRTGHETTDWFKAGKGVYKGCILSLCLFNFHAEYIMKCWAGWGTSWNQSAWRNITGLRYADLAEREEELKSLLMKVTEKSEKAGLKLNIKKMKIIASPLITWWQINGEKLETVTDFIFLGSKITAVTAVIKLIEVCCLEEKLWQT